MSWSSTRNQPSHHHEQFNGFDIRRKDYGEAEQYLSKRRHLVCRTTYTPPASYLQPFYLLYIHHILLLANSAKESVKGARTNVEENYAGLEADFARLYLSGTDARISSSRATSPVNTVLIVFPSLTFVHRQARVIIGGWLVWQRWCRWL